MPKFTHKATGQTIEVGASRVQDLAKNPEWEAASDEVVSIVDDTGRAQEVQLDKLRPTDAVETGAQAAQRTRGERLEQTRGTKAGQLGTFIDRGLSAATFGATDLLKDDVESQAALEFTEANPDAATGGTVVGAVLPSLLAPGVGVPGTLAKLSPRGALAAATAKYVGQGATAGQRVGRGIVTGLVEGGIDTGGAYLSRVALDEDVKFSGAELGREMVMGSLIGGATGGLGGAVTPADEATQLATLRRAIPESDAAKVRELLESSADRGARRTLGADTRRFKKADDLIDLEDIASPGMVTRSRQSYEKMQERIVDASRRKATDEAEEVLSSPFLRAALTDEEFAATSAKLRTLAQGHDEAAAAARQWGDAHRAVVGTAKNSSEFGAALKRVAPELDDAAGPTLARLDEAVVDFEGEVGKLRSALQVTENIDPALKGAAAFDPAVSGQIRSFLASTADKIKANPVVARTIETGEKVAGALETAQMLGVDVPSVSSLLGRDNVIGQAVGFYLQAKAGVRALKGKGEALSKIGFLSTPMTRAAATVNAGKARVVSALDSAATSATTKVRRAAAPLVTTGAVKAFAAMDPVALRAEAAQEAAQLPSHVASAVMDQVERTTGYLESKRPKNPNQGTPWAKDWRPDPVADAEYARRAKAALDPLWAVREIFSRPGNSLEVEALKQCHPDLFAEAQARLIQLTDAQREAMSEPLRLSLGRAFGVPLSLTQLPGYGATTLAAMQRPMTPAPQFGEPSAASTSPFVQGEAVEGPRRRG